MAAHSKGVLNIGALPFSECNERLPLVAIQRPTGANAILLRYSLDSPVPLIRGGPVALDGRRNQRLLDRRQTASLIGGVAKGYLIGFDRIR